MVNSPHVPSVRAVLDRLFAFANQLPHQRGISCWGAMGSANRWFWAAMLAAGALGAAAGDFLAFDVRLGVAAAAVAMTIDLAAALCLRAPTVLVSVATFWAAVVVIRTWGTNVGGLLADHAGLTVGTAVTGAAFVGLLLAWPVRSKAVVVPVELSKGAAL